MGLETEAVQDSSISTRSDGIIWCSKCNMSLGDKWNKSIKQHQKSKTHKKGQASKPAKKSRKQREAEDSEEENEEEEEANATEATTSIDDCNMAECSLCYLMKEKRDHDTSIAGTNFCMAPPVLSKPSIRPTPFITKQGGTLPLYPDCLEDALQNYCVGKASRMPNVDINHECCEVKSLSETRKILKDAQINKDIYWCALAIDDDVTDPDWWPEGDKVPGYTQLIIASGATDIGIHLDQYGKMKIPVNTYLTICRGIKQVIMLPPGKNDLFTNKDPFPLNPTPELVQKIKEREGYFFEVKPFSDTEFAALFIPKGWYHWLIGKTEWAVGYGSSRF